MLEKDYDGKVDVWSVTSYKDFMIMPGKPTDGTG
jgi:pyruvate dehydrogenase complex dehydrogenase (E1) component